MNENTGSIETMDDAEQIDFSQITERSPGAPAACLAAYKKYFDENRSGYTTPSRMAVRAAIAIVEAQANVIAEQNTAIAALTRRVKALTTKVNAITAAPAPRKGDRLKTGGRTLQRVSARRVSHR